MITILLFIFVGSFIGITICLEFKVRWAELFIWFFLVGMVVSAFGFANLKEKRDVALGYCEAHSMVPAFSNDKDMICVDTNGKYHFFLRN